MKKLLKKFIKNKSFIVWCLSILILLFFFFNPVFSIKKQYMFFNNISDYCYIYYVFLLPMSFYDMSFINCIFLELIYYSLIMYISVSYRYSFKVYSHFVVGRTLIPLLPLPASL